MGKRNKVRWVIQSNLISENDFNRMKEVCDVGGNLFWGAMLVGDEWVGENTLGKLWMSLRKQKLA